MLNDDTDSNCWSISTQTKVVAGDAELSQVDESHDKESDAMVDQVWQQPLAVLQMERAERDVVQSLDHGIVTPYNTLKTLLSAKGPAVPQVTAVILYHMWVRAPSTAAVYDGISVLVDDEVTLHASIAAFIEEHVVVGTVGKPRCRVDEQWMRVVLDSLVIDEFKLWFTDDKIREALYAKWIAFVQSNVWYDSYDAWVDLFTGKMTIDGKPMASVDASERVDAAVCGDMGEFLMPHFSDIGDQREYIGNPGWGRVAGDDKLDAIAKGRLASQRPHPSLCGARMCLKTVTSSSHGWHTVWSKYMLHCVRCGQQLQRFTPNTYKQSSQIPCI